MPPPGFRRRGFQGPGRRGGPAPWGWGPRRGGLGPLGVIGAVATGAAVAAAVTAPPRRRYPPPRAGYIYVVPAAGQPPREVRAEEMSFMIMRVQIANHRQGSGGEILYQIQYVSTLPVVGVEKEEEYVIDPWGYLNRKLPFIEVTMNDGYQYSVLRRYSQFDQFRARVAPIVSAVSAPFPPKYGVRAATFGLGPAEIQNRKAMLQSWLQSICTAASANLPRLRLPVYDFLETALYYPPETISVTEIAAAPAPTAAAPASAPATGVPYATATPYPEAAVQPYEPPQAANFNAATSDGWAVPIQSREASDMKFAMSGPNALGRLEAGKVANVLRSNTRALSEDLRAIWELCDMDKDGMLDRDEFAVAWYLATEAAAGRRPPASLPADLMPPSKRAAPRKSLANPF